jgi:peptide/nickel transport system permease protein
MMGYFLRRIFYALPILVGVNLLTFALFFMVNSPDDMARMQLGQKHISETAVTEWKIKRGYNFPLFYNADAAGQNKIRDTLFFQKSLRLFVFDFGFSDAGRDIKQDVLTRMWPSFAIALPSLLFGLLVNITFALLMVFFRGTYLDLSGVIFCIMLMSISSLFYIMGGQYLFGKVLRLVPISGYDYGLESF